MTTPSSRSEPAASAPQAFRDALAEFVQIGLRVARMVGQIADAETALAEAAAQSGIADGVSAVASSLAEAIEADRAAAAAAEMRQTVVARIEAVAAAFARVSRSVRLTIMLAERLDRGWARGGAPDDRHALAKRQIARAVEDAVGRETESEPASARDAVQAERLDTPDREPGLGDRSAEEIIAEICHLLRLDPVRMLLQPPVPGAADLAEWDGPPPQGRNRPGWAVPKPHRRPDG